MTAVVTDAPMFDAVFASDVHLSAAHPTTTEAFFAFVDAAVVGRTRQFFILGDLFEYWLGDDDLDDALAKTVAVRLRGLHDDGIAVAFQHGNRDFLVGPAFAEAAGLTLLPDPHTVRIGHLDLLLSHGDALCIDDVDYQRFRAMVRDLAWQRAFLGKPLEVRRAIGKGARAESEAAKEGKSAAIMDVNDDAVTTLLADHGNAVLVHGHTHRPAAHLHVVGGTERERRVLTDWNADAATPRGGGLAVVDGRIVVLGMDGNVAD